MAGKVVHAKVSGLPAGINPSRVYGADWDADHVITGLNIGSDVQAWSAQLDTWATKIAPTGTVADLTSTQTFTNKTLTSPAITTPAISGIATVTAAPGTLNKALQTYSSPNGTAGSNLTTAWNEIRITGDIANLPGGQAFGVGLHVFHDAGSSNLQGSRTAIIGNLQFTGPSSASNAFPEYVGITGISRGNTGDGGTSGSPRGAIWASNFVATASGTANYLNGLLGSEVNIGAESGLVGLYRKFGWNIVALGTDVVQATNFDAAYSVSSQTGAVGWKAAVSINNANGQFPVASNGSILTATTGSVTHGVDLNAVTFSGYAFRSPYFAVDGSGNIIGTNLVLSSGVVAPVVVGSSTGTTGTQLTIKTTAANGTTDALAIVGGNNGATSFATLNATKLNLPQTTAASSASTGALTVGGGIGVAGAGYFGGIVSAAAYQVSGLQVVAARDTGWAAWTGTPNKNTAFDTSTVTLPNLAARVAALQAALTNSHGLIGA